MQITGTLYSLCTQAYVVRMFHHIDNNMHYELLKYMFKEKSNCIEELMTSNISI